MLAPPGAPLLHLRGVQHLGRLTPPISPTTPIFDQSFTDSNPHRASMATSLTALKTGPWKIHGLQPRPTPRPYRQAKTWRIRLNTSFQMTVAGYTTQNRFLQRHPTSPSSFPPLEGCSSST